MREFEVIKISINLSWNIKFCQFVRQLDKINNKHKADQTRNNKQFWRSC